MLNLFVVRKYDNIDEKFKIYLTFLLNASDENLIKRILSAVKNFKNKFLFYLNNIFKYDDMVGESKI